MQYLFDPPVATRGYRLFALAGIGLLYLAGVVHWLLFYLSAARGFSFYVMRFSAYDWPREYVFLSTLQDAILQGVVPYHITPAIKGTMRFLGIPDYLTSPQLLLLRWTDPATFVLLNTVLLYSVSFLACLAIRKRYRLSLVSFAVLYLLVHFNGHITSHLGSGQHVWLGFFLLPLYCLFVLELVEGELSWMQTLKLALVLWAMLIQGTYHFYLWGVGFLVLLLLFDRRFWRPVMGAIALSILLGAFRLIPSAVAFWSTDRRFLTGYPTLWHLFEALVVVKGHDVEHLGVLGRLAWWEYDFYIGVIGAALVGYFGIYRHLRERLDPEWSAYRALEMPMLTMAVFSMSLFYAP
ncbi:MAG: hypothetical protein ACRDIB_09235, partial [Ardenticatenaceae bacterium]